MGVGIKVGSITDEIGSSDFLHAFFSTISGNLEHEWGVRFPALMQLYEGSLPADRASTGLTELIAVRSELATIPPCRVIWDIEDRSKSPPWGTAISREITDLSNYFVTSTGRDLFDLLQEALEAARDGREPAEIVQF